MKPYRGGWTVFESPGVSPFYIGPDSKQNAVDYAKTRQGFSRGQIRVLNSNGEVLETISFNDSEKRF